MAKRKERGSSKCSKYRIRRQGSLKNIKKLGYVALASGKITAVDGTTLTIEKDGKTLTVLTDDKTQFRRLYWGKSSLDEMKAGNTVNVFGHWTDEAKTTILARMVRNLSIQKRYGVFFGVVQSINSNGWVMTTVSGNRENQTVIVSSLTKFTDRKEETITQGDIVVGHRVRVKGLWDKSSNTVSEVKSVKDFNLPPKPSGTPVTTPTNTPATTATPMPSETPTPTPEPTP
jgi:hypothetical protein